MRSQLDPKAAGAQRFADKVCVITGAGQGIGLATARRLAAEGGAIVIADVAEKPAQELHEILIAHGVTSKVVICDLSLLSEAERLMKEAVSAFGKIDALVNNVGGTIWIRPFERYSEEQIKRELDRSFWTAAWCCRAAIPHMLEQGFGSIVNVGSTSPRGIYRIPYAAAKGGVFALTTSLARETARKGIRVNCVAPGATKVEERPTVRNPYDKQLTEEEQLWVKELNQFFDFQYPMGRWGTIEEQAAAIAFMASDDASYITGQILTVAGGESVT